MWDDPSARVLACTIAGIGRDEADLHVILNMSDQMIEAETPELPDRLWHVAVDTAQAPPGDLLEPARQVPVSGRIQRVAPRSVTVLEARSIRNAQAARPATGKAGP